MSLFGVLGCLFLVSSTTSQWTQLRWLGWLLALLIVGIPDDWERIHPLGSATLPMAMVSLAGVWSAVPDTEPPLVVAMVLLPFALATGIPRCRGARGAIPVGPIGTIALVLSISGSTWVGSAGWGAARASVIAVGMILVAPAVIGFGATARSNRLAALTPDDGPSTEMTPGIGKSTDGKSVAEEPAAENSVAGKPTAGKSAESEVSRVVLSPRFRVVLVVSHVVVAILVPRILMRRSVLEAVVIACSAFAVLVLIAVLVRVKASVRRIGDTR